MVNLTIDRRNVLRVTGAGIAGLAAIGSSDSYITPSRAESPTANIDRTAGPVDDGDVLIIKDCEPWNIPASEIALSELGVPYEVSSMEEASTAFSGETAAGEYQAVILPSSQPTEYYISLGELRPRLDAFVEAGGVLLAHMGNRGQPCNSVMDMPLSVTSDFSRYEAWQSSGDDTAESLQEIMVTAPDHEVMRRFSDADVSSWSSAFTSFGEITGLPSDATVLASLAASTDAATFVEYPKGDGRVLATMQIMEWPYGDGEQFGGTETFLKTVLEYAVDELSDTPSAEIAIDPPNPTIRTPVTLQVTDPDPTDSDYTYQWELTSAPMNEPPSLLDENVESSRPDKSTVLTPPEAGTYRVGVTVEDGATVVGRGVTTVDVIPDEFTDWQVSEAFVSDDNDATPSFDLSQFEEADSAAELAVKYAPTINFHPEETYYPTRYEAAFENANIDINDRERTIAEQVSAIDIGNEDLDPEYDPTAEDNYLYLRGTEDDFRRYQDEYPNAVYASVTGTTIPGGTPPLAPDSDTSYIALTYWCFYLFDPKTDDGPANLLKQYLSRHTSDTETFTILFSESGPEWIGAAQHYSGEFMRWEKVGGEDIHVEIYPAKGAHSTFFVNTDRYEGGIPQQVRFIDKVRESTFVIPTGYAAADETATNGDTWSTDEYELLLLSEDSGISKFGGKFVSVEDEGGAVSDGGKLPQARGDRWNDPGPWIPERKLRETKVLSARGSRTNQVSGPFWINTTTASGTPQIEGTVFNDGVKPHPFVVEVTVSRADTGALAFEQSREIQLPTDGRYRERKSLTISLEGISQPERKHDVDIDFRTYPSGIGVSEDRLERTVRTITPAPAETVEIDRMTAVPQVAPADHGTVGSVETYADATADETTAPGESVKREITFTNTGAERQTFTLELRAQGRKNVSFGGDETTETVTLDPGETRTAELSTVVPVTVPEGSYDLTSIVWLEADADNRFTKLAEETNEDAVIVEKPVHELTIESTPTGAEVALNEARLGRTPVTVDRRIGHYDIFVSKEGYVSAFERIVHEDGDTTVRIDLEARSGSDSETEQSGGAGVGMSQQFSGVPLERIAAGGAVTAGLAYLSVRLMSNTNE